LLSDISIVTNTKSFEISTENLKQILQNFLNPDTSGFLQIELYLGLQGNIKIESM